jgi:hypothetical protein
MDMAADRDDNMRMANEQRQRFPLRFSIETGIPTGREPFNAQEYRIELGRGYEVASYDEQSQTRRVRGACHVEGVEGAFTVIPLFDLSPPYASRTFYAAWDVDGESIARLSEVLLIEGSSGEATREP